MPPSHRSSLTAASQDSRKVQIIVARMGQDSGHLAKYVGRAGIIMAWPAFGARGRRALKCGVSSTIQHPRLGPSRLTRATSLVNSKKVRSHCHRSVRRARSCAPRLARSGGSPSIQRWGDHSDLLCFVQVPPVRYQIILPLRGHESDLF